MGNRGEGYEEEHPVVISCSDTRVVMEASLKTTPSSIFRGGYRNT